MRFEVHVSELLPKSVTDHFFFNKRTITSCDGCKVYQFIYLLIYYFFLTDLDTQSYNEARKLKSPR